MSKALFMSLGQIVEARIQPEVLKRFHEENFDNTKVIFFDEVDLPNIIEALPLWRGAREHDALQRLPDAREDLVHRLPIEEVGIHHRGHAELHRHLFSRVDLPDFKRFIKHEIFPLISASDSSSERGSVIRNLCDRTRCDSLAEGGPQEAALIFKEGEDSTILVSDLHLGLEKEMAAKGFRIPPYSMKIMDRINSVAEKYKANRIVVLGDVKHSIGKVEDIDWNVLPWFFDTLLDVFSSVEVVPGNHDGGIKTLLPSRVKLHPSVGNRDRFGGEGRGDPRALVAVQEVIACGRMVIGHSHFRYEMRDRFGARSKEAVWLFAGYDIGELLQKAGLPERVRGRGRADSDAALQQPGRGPGDKREGRLRLRSGALLWGVDVKDADMFLLDGTTGLSLALA